MDSQAGGANSTKPNERLAAATPAAAHDPNQQRSQQRTGTEQLPLGYTCANGILSLHVYSKLPLPRGPTCLKFVSSLQHFFLVHTVCTSYHTGYCMYAASSLQLAILPLRDATLHTDMYHFTFFLTSPMEMQFPQVEGRYHFT